MARRPRIALIGAGSSGIAAAKVLAERGVAFDAFEASDRVGGNWVYRNKNGTSACYRSLSINTSKRRMEYSDFPMPDDYPDFPDHFQIARYFEAYVDRFGIRDAIRFETKVTHVAPDDRSGGFVVRTESLRDGRVDEGRYEAVVVANGHHWDPRWPDPPIEGRFDGVTMHSHAYDEPDMFESKRVVVVGMGNSAMDIAVEASEVASETRLVSRRGAWVLPRYFFGLPADSIPLSPRIPFALRRRFVELMLKLSVGSPERHGLPRPDHRLGDAHPTVSDRILERVASGAIQMRPEIARLDGREIVYVDGTREPADVLVYCTGYRVSFPFFDEGFVSAPDNELPLFRRVFHPARRGVFFLGLLQPLGAIMPIAEAQAAWIADYVNGRYALPDAVEMRADIAEERARMRERYVASPRHTMQVDFDDYLFELERERRRGAERAARGGFIRPLG
ncbi:MAG: flavin-containing monooxygenase [Sandaracinaceae bacterium]